MDIDLVYMWVDGNDPAWRAKKNLYLPKDEQLEVAAAGDCRYVSNDELKYSLRSAEKFAPWIHRIYIITDNQCPEWLDTANERVRIVDHTEIIPKEYLPLFNASSIEWHMANVPGLSEHFLFANDDTFFGAPVTPDFFFDNNGNPIVRFKPLHVKKNGSLYSQTMWHVQHLVKERLGKKFTLAPHHNIDAYRKSWVNQAIEEFRPEVEAVSRCRFRERGHIDRYAADCYAIARLGATMRRVGRYNRAKSWREVVAGFFAKRYMTDSRCIPLTVPDFGQVLRRYNPVLFALNDSETATDADRARMRRFLEEMFPEKSSFEK